MHISVLIILAIIALNSRKVTKKFKESLQILYYNLRVIVPIMGDMKKYNNVKEHSSWISLLQSKGIKTCKL